MALNNLTLWSTVYESSSFFHTISSFRCVPTFKFFGKKILHSCFHFHRYSGHLHFLFTELCIQIFFLYLYSHSLAMFLRAICLFNSKLLQVSLVLGTLTLSSLCMLQTFFPGLFFLLCHTGFSFWSSQSG